MAHLALHLLPLAVSEHSQAEYWGMAGLVVLGVPVQAAQYGGHIHHQNLVDHSCKLVTGVGWACKYKHTCSHHCVQLPGCRSRFLTACYRSAQGTLQSAECTCYGNTPISSSLHMTLYTEMAAALTAHVAQLFGADVPHLGVRMLAGVHCF
jgi:hypothetical protein